MKKIICTLFIAFIACSAFAQSKAEKIKTVLELTTSGNVGEKVMKQIIEQFAKIYPKVDKKFWDEFSNAIKTEDLIKMITPIYDKYYSEQDLDNLIAFYKTPTGKKVIESMPVIAQESMAAGQEWGQKIAEQAHQKLIDKGYIKE